MKEDDPTTNQGTPSINTKRVSNIKNQNQATESLKAEAYKLKRWRNQARQTEVTEK